MNRTWRVRLREAAYLALGIGLIYVAAFLPKDRESYWNTQAVTESVGQVHESGPVPRWVIDGALVERSPEARWVIDGVVVERGPEARSRYDPVGYPFTALTTTSYPLGGNYPLSGPASMAQRARVARALYGDYAYLTPQYHYPLVAYEPFRAVQVPVFRPVQMQAIRPSFQPVQPYSLYGGGRAGFLGSW